MVWFKRKTISENAGDLCPLDSVHGQLCRAGKWKINDHWMNFICLVEVKFYFLQTLDAKFENMLTVASGAWTALGNRICWTIDNELNLFGSLCPSAFVVHVTIVCTNRIYLGSRCRTNELHLWTSKFEASIGFPLKNVTILLQIVASPQFASQLVKRISVFNGDFFPKNVNFSLNFWVKSPESTWIFAFYHKKLFMPTISNKSEKHIGIMSVCQQRINFEVSDVITGLFEINKKLFLLINYLFSSTFRWFPLVWRAVHENSHKSISYSCHFAI